MTTAPFPALLPEATLLGGALLFVALSPFKRPGPALLALVALLGPVCGAAVLVAAVLALGAEGRPFSGYALSGFSQLGKLLLAVPLFAQLVACGRLPGIAPRFRALHQGLLLLGAFCMMILCGADNLALFVAALLLGGLGMALLPLLREGRARGAFRNIAEWAPAAVAALLGLGGLVCLGILGGGFELSALARDMPPPPKWALAGFAFALIPPLCLMALWPPQGRLPERCRAAALESAGALAVLPGIAGLLALLRLLPCLPPGHGPFVSAFFALLGLLALFSGSLRAQDEDGLKPFLAWQGISRSGCVLLALVPLAPASGGLALYVALCSALTASACWLALSGAGGRNADPRLADLRGLMRAQPARAGLLALGALGPAGFMTTFLLLAALARAGRPLVAAATGLGAVLAFAPCLRLARALCEPHELKSGDDARDLPPLGPAAFAVGVTLILALLLLGVLPARFLELADRAAQNL